jgi:hypothetical protein
LFFDLVTGIDHLQAQHFDYFSAPFVGFGLPNAFKVRPQLIFRLCGNFFYVPFGNFIPLKSRRTGKE